MNPMSLVASAAAQVPTPSSLEQRLTSEAAALAAIPGEIGNLPLLRHLAEVLPAADIVFGGSMLILIILIHATGVRTVGAIVDHRMRAIMVNPRGWRADIVMALSVLLLLCLHLFETTVWAGSLVYGGLVTSWRAAGFFAGNTYTTVGYGNFILSEEWEMLAPIIAMSGLFTFGWSTSVLVDIVARCQRVKDAAASRAAGRRHIATPRQDA